MAPVTRPDPLARAGIGDAAAAARAAWRADEEEWTRAAAEQWHHGRTLVDVLREHLHRGDTVALTIGTTTVTGTLGAVGEDLVSMVTPDGRADTRVAGDAPILLRVVERAPSGGTRGWPVSTFRARLLEIEASGMEVEIVTQIGDVVRGELHMARDHLSVRTDDGVGSVALAAVAWVRVPAP
jgi:hypothetical protein